MRFGLKIQEENIKADAKPKNDITRFFENELSKLNNLDFLDIKMCKKNQENYKLSKNY